MQGGIVDCTEELGTSAPASVQQLASSGGGGVHASNVWRDLRSQAGIAGVF